MVRHFHLYNTTEAIRLPDADGVFPATTLWRASLVVVDANTLRNDIIYACRHEGTPTTLVNGANSQMLRLFCARHVLEELHEHYQEWCEEEDVPVAKFVKHFKTSYAPLLRAVRQVPDGLLSTEEQDRVEVLRVDDPDDIPSVTLALLLRAFYMSEDLKACRAVYGREFSNDEVRAWREVLGAGGDAGVVGSLFQVGADAHRCPGMGVWGLFDKLTGSLNPWIRLLIAGVVIGGGGYLYHRMPEERRDGVRNGLEQALNVAAAFSAEYVAAITRMNRALPAAPSWERARWRAAATERANPRVPPRSRPCAGSSIQRLSSLSYCRASESAKALRWYARCSTSIPVASSPCTPGGGRWARRWFALHGASTNRAERSMEWLTIPSR